MPKFRKKPVEIEAFQLTSETRSSNENWPEWMHAAWNNNPEEPGALIAVEGAQRLEISTLEGTLNVSLNDWIIQGVQGEIYPCKPDIFAATYEPVDQ